MGARKQEYQKAVHMLCLNKYKYEPSGSSRNGRRTVLRNKKMSSLDDLRYGGFTVKIKSHRNPEFLECVCVCVQREREKGGGERMCICGG